VPKETAPHPRKSANGPTRFWRRFVSDELPLSRCSRAACSRSCADARLPLRGRLAHHCAENVASHQGRVDACRVATARETGRPKRRLQLAPLVRGLLRDKLALPEPPRAVENVDTADLVLPPAPTVRSFRVADHPDTILRSSQWKPRRVWRVRSRSAGVIDLVHASRPIVSVQRIPIQEAPYDPTVCRASQQPKSRWRKRGHDACKDPLHVR
jgi:hypothetical protein